MVRYSCCVSMCKSLSVKGSEITFIQFPQDQGLREQWKAVIGRGPDFSITDNTRICSKHFRTGKRSLNPNSEDYAPSVFETQESIMKKSNCKKCRKVTLNCPCKLMAMTSQNQVEESEEEEEVGLRLLDQEGEEEDEEQQEDAEEGSEESAEEPAEEEEPDAGQVVDSDDDEWTPVEEEKPKNSRRSSRRSRKRRQSSSDDESPPDSPQPPAKLAKTKTPQSAKKETNVVNSKTTPSSRRRGGTVAVVAQQTATEEDANGTSSTTKNGSPHKMTDNSAPIGRKRGLNKFVYTPPPPPPSDTKLLEKIKEMEEEHSRKLETLQRNYNMRIANLQEENTQRLHKMKLEWEIERCNLQTQIDFYKESVHNGNVPEEELPLNTESFREDQPIIIVRTEHLQDPSFRDE